MTQTECFDLAPAGLSGPGPSRLYQNVLTADVNEKGVLDVDTVKFPKREQKIIVAYKGDIKAIPDNFRPLGRL